MKGKSSSTTRRAAAKPSQSPSTTGNGSAVLAPVRCPFLGAITEPADADASVSELTYCHHERIPVPVSSIHREYYCLTAEHTSCPVFKTAPTFQAAPTPAPVVERTYRPVPVPESVKPVDTSWPAVDSDDDPLLPVSPLPLPDSIFLPVDALPMPAVPDLPVADLFDWAKTEEADFPIIDPNIEVVVVPRRSRNRNARRYLILGLLFLGLLIMGWWIWLNYLMVEGGGGTSSGNGAGLPTLAATADAALLGWGSTSSTTDSGAGSPEESGIEGDSNAIAPETDGDEPVDEVDFNAIALTATALFAGVPPAGCVPPAWWVLYVIQPGDTVTTLAASRAIRPEEILQANCLQSDELTAVAMIYLPPVGSITTFPATPTPIVVVRPTNPPAPLPTNPIIQFPTAFPVVPPTSTPVVIVLPTNEPPAVVPTNPPPQPTSPPPEPTNPPPEPTSTPPTPEVPTSEAPPTSTPPPLP